MVLKVLWLKSLNPELNKEIPKERYISPEKRQKIVVELRLIQYINKIENQKVINLLDNTSNQPSKSRTKNWVEINDNSRGTYNTNSHIKLKTSMVKSILCDYSDVYTLVKGRITIAAAEMIILKLIKTLEKLLVVKEMIIQLVAY